MGARTRRPGEPTLFPIDEPEPAKAPAPSADPPQPVADGFCDVALNRPMRCEFSYGVPPELRGSVRPGMRVAVPFARGREVGVVVRVQDTCDVPRARLKSIARLLDDEPVAGEDMLALTAWIAERYAASWGEALAAVLPAPLKREGGTRKVLTAWAAESVGPEELASLETRHPKQHRLLRNLLDLGQPVEARDLLRRLNLSDSPLKTLVRRGWVLTRRVDARPDELLSSRVERPRPERLTDDQARAVAAIVPELEAGRHQSFLLRGVTGSGKTEVYLRTIERALELGQSAIVLVPEIALTPQTVGWFRSRFGEIAVLHSRMTDAQRLDMWRRARRGEARVVVGARSAVFAPVRDLGVVVVDEEHEPSFKQGNAPRYHAREVAVERARQAGAVCILGSATPAMESWWRAGAGIHRLVSLPTRIAGGGMPPVDVVDLRLEADGGVPLFSRKLLHLLREAVAEGEQAILFLNRRGFVPVLFCPGCLSTLRCERCSMSLTYHRRIERLVCHGCCEEMPLPGACPTCSRPGLRALGSGSERVERVLGDLLPGVRTRRMDSDTMRRREDYEETLEAFGRGEFDVLVGTQMIAKGLDFPNVTVVGIVLADQGLHLADFRAEERTFQLIAQVAGRAGRGERPGRIVVQTHMPENAAIRLASGHDYTAFAQRELEVRRELGYPPFGRLLRVVFEDEEEARVVASSEALGESLEALREPELEILGPGPAPIALLRGRHRHHLLVKAAPQAEGFARARDRALEHAATGARPQVAVDVDPVSML